MKDFQRVFLTESDESILREASSGGIVCCHPVSALHLIDCEFISEYCTQGEYVVTPLGLQYLNYLTKRNVQEKKTYRLAVIGTICGIIGAAVSIVALIVAIIK